MFIVQDLRVLILAPSTLQIEGFKTTLLFKGSRFNNTFCEAKPSTLSVVILREGMGLTCDNIGCPTVVVLPYLPVMTPITPVLLHGNSYKHS